MNGDYSNGRGKLPQNFTKQQSSKATAYNNDKSSNNYNKKHGKLKKSLSECENYSNNNNSAAVVTSSANHIQSPASTKRKKKEQQHPQQSQQQRNPSVDVTGNYIANNNNNSINNNIINSNDMIVDDSDDFRRFNSLRCDNKNKSQLNLYSIDRNLTASQYLAYQQRLKDMKNDSNYDNFSSSSTSTDYRGPLKNNSIINKPTPTAAGAAADASNSNKRMTRNNRIGMSSLSLCSCDADTEVIS